MVYLTEELIDLCKLTVSELRLFPIDTPNGELTDENILKAMTVNEELKNLGYTLKPMDIVSLAKSKSLDDFMDSFKVCLSDVKAKPMYPNFPKQVMEIGEAEFRLHQLMHYFSTYGLESIFGVNVSRGWLPNVEDTEKIKDDETLLNAKVIELSYGSGKDDSFQTKLYKTILSKRERMTLPEKEIIAYCIPTIKEENLVINIPFKQNMMDIFYYIFSSVLRKEYKLDVLSSICQHTGDVFKCIDYCLTRCKYHFKTSQKRLLVKVLEKFNVEDFRSNLIITNKKAKRTELILRYLDFNMYAKNSKFIRAVNELRDSELKSWQSNIIKLIDSRNGTNDMSILTEVAKRPGMAIRMLTYLLRHGFNSSDIYDALTPKASELNTQTLVTLCTKFGEFAYISTKDENFTTEKYNEMQNVYSICYRLFKDKFTSIETPLKGRKVYINLDEYNLECSKILTNDKSAEGGYIRSGFAYNIPDNVNTLRFFVYWNDKSRVDLDLHSSYLTKDNQPRTIGWNSAYKNDGLIFSGDITHSNAAEYIDIDFKSSSLDVSKAFVNIVSYTGQHFKDIEECYVGAMAVKQLGEDVKLYNLKNCFFTHNLRGDYTTINYGFVDCINRCIIFDGKENTGAYSNQTHNYTAFNLETYINTLCITQNIERVNTPEEADYILIMAKPTNDKEISLIDNNFWLDN